MNPAIDVSPTRPKPCAALLGWLALSLFTANFNAPAARISEPDTTFYGKVVQYLKGREFMVTSGELVWKLKTSGPAGGEYQFTNQLQSLAADRYSYQLRIPHQLLAYDLLTASNTLPLPAAGATIQEISVFLNGEPLALSPQAVSGISLSPQTRASAYRLDLQFETEPLDSDGDGLPDWWEDAHGFDKWDASDGSAVLPGSGGGAILAPAARTFAEWRSVLFQEEIGDLQAFGEKDNDGDGISNLLEYAFDLDPRQAEASTADAIPRLARGPADLELTFRRRLLATDLEFHIDISTNLVVWTDSTADLHVTTDSNTGRTTVQTNATVNGAPQQFYRVRVLRINAP